jgi:hypothetical protein
MSNPTPLASPRFRSRLGRRLAFVAATASLLVSGFGVSVTAANASASGTVKHPDPR